MTIAWNVTLLSVQSVMMGIDSNMFLRNVSCLQLTVHKNVPYAPQMSVSHVRKGTPHNLFHLVSIVRLCMHETQRVNAKLFNQIARLIQIVSHVLSVNVDNVSKDSNLILIKNVLLNDHFKTNKAFIKHKFMI